MLTVSSETSLNLNFFSHFVALLNISSFVEFLERNIFLFHLIFLTFDLWVVFFIWAKDFFHGSSRAARLSTTFFIFSYEYFYFDGRKKHKERAEIGRERYFMISIFQWIKYYIPWLVVFFCVEKKLDINQNLPRIS